MRSAAIEHTYERGQGLELGIAITVNERGGFGDWRQPNCVKRYRKIGENMLGNETYAKSDSDQWKIVLL